MHPNTAQESPSHIADEETVDKAHWFNSKLIEQRLPVISPVLVGTLNNWTTTWWNDNQFSSLLLTCMSMPHGFQWNDALFFCQTRIMASSQVNMRYVALHNLSPGCTAWSCRRLLLRLNKWCDFSFLAHNTKEVRKERLCKSFFF